VCGVRLCVCVCGVCGVCVCLCVCGVCVCVCVVSVCVCLFVCLAVLQYTAFSSRRFPVPNFERFGVQISTNDRMF